MKRFVMILLLGVMSFMALPSFTSAAGDYPYFGPQGLEDDFLWFGNDDFPSGETQGINIEIDYTSVSFQSVIATVTFDEALINDREITRFYVTANGRIVDFFDPAWDTDNDMWKRNYVLRLAFDNWNIGSIINLRVIGVTDQEISPIDPNITNKYVVAWSNKPASFQLKDQPVIDRTAIEVLNAILAKLEQMRSDITGAIEKMRADIMGQLAKIDASIKKIYEISPQTQAKFDAALANLQSKLPTEQIKEQTKEIQKTVENSANRINNANQVLKFGQINWFGVVVTSAIDLTAYAEQIALLRKILQITLWCEFFYFVILVLRPRLTV